MREKRGIGNSSPASETTSGTGIPFAASPETPETGAPSIEPCFRGCREPPALLLAKARRADSPTAAKGAGAFRIAPPKSRTMPERPRTVAAGLSSNKATAVEGKSSPVDGVLPP